MIITDSQNIAFSTGTQLPITIVVSQSGTVTPGSLISVDASNALKEGTDEKLFVPSASVGGVQSVTGDGVGGSGVDVVMSFPTLTQLGLENVDNTSDADKPVSTATQTEIDTKQDVLVSGTNIKTVNSQSLLGAGDIVISGSGGATNHSELTLDDGTNPHGTTKADVGLSNVPNTDLTSAVALNTAKVSNVDHPLVETAVPTGAVFTDTVYDDTTIQAEVDLNTAKVGITPTQASNITTNNAKISYTDATQVATNVSNISTLQSEQTTQDSAIALNTAKTGITAQQSADITANNAKVGVTNEEQNTINSTTTGEPTGSDLVLNVVSLTQAEYDAGTPVATTLYVITDA